jgi:hypothetical protein
VIGVVPSAGQMASWKIIRIIKNVKNAVKAKAAKTCMEMEQMKVKITRDDNAITSEDKEDHDNKITNKDDEEDEDHEDDEDNEDDKDHDNHDDKITSEDDKDNDDDNDDNNDDVGAFNNEVEGGVPCAPHSTLIKKLHILNQTPTYRRSIIEKDEIDLLIKKLLEMKLRREIGGRVVCGLGNSWTYKKEEIGKHSICRMAGGRKGFPEIIRTGDNPSLGEVITAIKRTKDTNIGKEMLIIEVPVDVLEDCGYAPFAQNTKVFITSRFETLF